MTIPYFSRFDCYALHFEAKICNLLHFGANIFHLHCILQHLEAEIANLDAIWEPLDLEFLVGRAFVARISENLHFARHDACFSILEQTYAICMRFATFWTLV